MLTVVALLIIVLGLMVSLAWDVRRQSSERLTKDLLRKLHVMMNQYTERHKRVPQVTAFIETGSDAGPVGVRSATASAAGSGQLLRRKAERATAEPSRPGGPIPLRTREDDLPDEASLLAAAEQNNREIVQVLRNEAAAPQPELFGPVGGATYDDVALRDAWGTPIVFMAGQHPAIGMALGNRPFFFSAGPDRRFRTLEDNLYSYEQGTSAARGE